MTGITLRWWNLAGPSVWFDEAYTAWAAGLPVGKLIAVVRVDNSPPLYYLLMHGWVRVFGNSEFALRAPSALAGTIVLLATLPLARRLFNNRRAELLSLLLASVSFLQIRYAQEARCYELLSLGAVVALFALTELERGNARRGHVLLIAALGTMTWMHNMAWLFVASALTAELLWPTHRSFASRVKMVVIHGVAVVALFAVWVPTLLMQMKTLSGGFWIARPDLFTLYYMTALVAGAKVVTLVGVFKRSIGSVQPFLWIAQMLIAASLIAIALSMFAKADPLKRRRVAAVGVAGLMPLLLAFGISLTSTSVFTPKALIASAAVLPFVLGGSVAVRSALVRNAATLGVIAMSALAMVSSVGGLTIERREDWQAVHEYLASLPSARRLIIFDGNDGELGLQYYDQRRSRIEADRTGVPRDFFDADIPRAMQRVSGPADVYSSLRSIQDGDYESIIFVGTHLSWSDPEDLMRQQLRPLLISMGRKNFDGVDVERFRRPHAN